MKYILLFVFCLGVNTTIFCQGTSSAEQKKSITTTHEIDGIQFDHEHTWEELLKKAKDENKLIYVDGYTTWCGPCKQMSKEVYTKKEVGDAYNANFISFKAQIDTSDNDNDYVKSHYQDFKAIATKYNVEVYPTHLFINGDGEMVHKAVGGMPAEKFIELAANASNPEKQFGTLNKKFEAGERSPAFLYNFVKAAASAYEPELSNKALDLYLPTQKDLFTKENLELILTITSSAENKNFALIKNNMAKINAVMGAGMAEQKTKSIILSSIVYPELYSNAANPDFNKIHSKVAAAVDKKYADNIINYVKINMLKSKKDWAGVDKAVTAYGPSNLSANELNDVAWTFFENVADKSLLKKALDWSLQSIQKESGSANTDTVANLYFKLGNKAKAIEYEEKALALAKQAGENTTEYEKVLENFRK
ncbi:MAG: thioredoxin fold domain-containing protein [Chitinophagaceae bacterium]|nr:thioredoxin fold domain-containing protein [Chitinophagaceae bacterium]